MTVQVPKPKRPWWIRGLRLLAMFAIVYLVVLIGALSFENTLVYLPQGADSWSSKPNDQVEDIQLSTADHGPIHTWWFPPTNPNNDRVVLYCHGNGGNLSHRGRHIVDMQNRLDGPGFLIFDYPGFGKITGSFSESGCYAATHAAYDWLVNTKQIAPSNIILLGESLGGGVAVELAMTQPCRKLVICCTYTRIPDAAAHRFWFLPCRLLMRNHFDSVERIKSFQGQLLVVHGTLDATIPFAQGQALFDAATTHTKQFFRLEGAKHCDYMDDALLNELKK